MRPSPLPTRLQALTLLAVLAFVPYLPLNKRLDVMLDALLMRYDDGRSASLVYYAELLQARRLLPPHTPTPGARVVPLRCLRPVPLCPPRPGRLVMTGCCRTPRAGRSAAYHPLCSLLLQVLVSWLLLGLKILIIAGVRSLDGAADEGCEAAADVESERAELGQVILVTGVLLLLGALYFTLGDARAGRASLRRLVEQPSGAGTELTPAHKEAAPQPAGTETELI